MGKEPQRARKSAVNPYPAPGDGRSTEPGPSQRPTSGVADNLESMGIDTADAIFIDGANDDPDDPRTIAQAMLRAAEKRAGIIPDDSARNDREDKEVCEKVDEIKQLILKLADSFPQTVGKPSDLILERLMKPENESLIRHIGWNALAGKNGENDWEDLLSSAVNRKALVFAILGTGLKGNVFSETFFGASPGISESLKNIDKEYRNSEGFYRTLIRAEFLQKNTNVEFDNREPYLHAKARVVLGLEKILLPLWLLGSSRLAWDGAKKRQELDVIVDTAGRLSQRMRKKPDAVYLWTPAYKDEEFDAASNECLNLEYMIRESPYEKKSSKGTQRAMLKPDQDHRTQAIIQIVCFPGLTIYRRGGGNIAQQELAKETAQNQAFPADVREQRLRGMPGLKDGLRTKMLVKSVVTLIWGQQRLLTKEAGTAAHIDAKRTGDTDKYDEDLAGCVELMELFEERFCSDN